MKGLEITGHYWHKKNLKKYEDKNFGTWAQKGG